MYYAVIFNNQPHATRVWATNRADAIKQAVRMTRGYLSMQDQRRNLVSAKIAKVQ